MMLPTTPIFTPGPRRPFSRRRSATAALVLAGLVLAGLGAPWTFVPARGAAPEFEPEERASALARPALVYVDVQWSGSVAGPPASDAAPAIPAPPGLLTTGWHCSGFFVNPDGHAVTAGHCLDPARARSVLLDRAAEAFPDSERASRRAALESSARIVGRDGTPGGDRVVTVRWGPVVPATASVPSGATGSDRALTASVLRADAGSGRVAVLKVDTTDDLPALALLADADVGNGRPVVALGYPGLADDHGTDAIAPVDRWGTMTAKREVGGRRFYDVAAASLGAMKGGPVVDMEGRVVGLAGLGPDGGEESFSVVPGDVVGEAVRAAGGGNATGALDETWQRSLDDLYQGRFDAAFAGFDSLVGQAGRGEAEAFRNRARDLAELEATHGDGTPVLIVVVLVVAAGAVVLVVTTRRRMHSFSRSNPEDVPL